MPEVKRGAEQSGSIAVARMMAKISGKALESFMMDF